MAKENAPKKQEAPKAPQRRKVLRIGIVQKGRIIDEKLILKPKTVTIGRAAANTFLIPSSDLPRTYRIFEYKNGKYFLNVSKGMDGRFAIGSKVYTLRQIIEDGKYAKQVRDHYQLDLSHFDRGKLVVGSITVLFHFVPEPKKKPKAKLPPSMWGIYSLKKWMGGVFTALLVFFVLIWAPATIAAMHWMYVKYDLAHVKSVNTKKALALIKNSVRVQQQKIREELQQQNQNKNKDSFKVKQQTQQSQKNNKKKNKKTQGSKKKKENDIASQLDIKDKEEARKANRALRDLNKIDDSALAAINSAESQLNNIPNLPAGAGAPNVPNVVPNVDTNQLAGAAVPSVEVEMGGSGAGKVLAADLGGGGCKGPNCVSAAAAYKAGSTTDGNINPHAVVGGGGGVAGPRGRRGRGHKVAIREPSGVNVDVSGLPSGANIPTNIPNVNVPTGGSVTIAGGSSSSTPSINIPTNKKKTSARISGSLAPGDADPALKRFMNKVFGRIKRCFRKSVSKGEISNGGKLTVTYRVSPDGSLSVVKLGGKLAGFPSFSACVRGAFRGKVKPKNGPLKSRTHTFSIMLQAM